MSLVMVSGVVAKEIVEFRFTAIKSRPIHAWIERLNRQLLEINLFRQRTFRILGRSLSTLRWAVVDSRCSQKTAALPPSDISCLRDRSTTTCGALVVTT